MRVCKYALESRRSPLCFWYSTLGLHTDTIVPILYFLTAARSQDRFDVSTGIVDSRSCWRSWTSSLAMILESVWLLLFYRCGWRIGLEILSVSIKVLLPSDDVDPPHKCIYFVLPRWPHAFCGSHLPSDLVRIEIVIRWLDNILYDGFHLSFNFVSRIVGPTLQTYIVMWLWVIIAKTYWVVPCLTNVWPFIVPSSLKPMTNFVPWSASSFALLWSTPSYRPSLWLL
jgi:hypothetical protein